ncbi:MAG: ATP-binding cassette domain-containing protein, partial [Thermoplasmata archaeon]
FNLQPVLTAIENVEFPLLVSGVDEKTAREMAMKALETVGLLEFKDHKPAELSGGQQQMVTIARSIVNEPAIIWADEPTGNLDTDSAKEIMKLLRKMNREKNQTYILVTHDPEVARYAERLIQMKNGRIERDKKQTPLC